MFETFYGALLFISSEALLERSARTAQSAPPLSFAAEPLHGQPQAGLHASNGLSQ